MSISLICIAALALLQFLLAINVSLNRMSSRMSHGVPEDPSAPLYRAVVAHRNACEYHPMLALLLYILPFAGQPAWSLWLGPAIVAVRTIHALSLIGSSLARPTPLRRLGAAGTYLLSLVLVGVLVAARLGNGGGSL